MGSKKLHKLEILKIKDLKNSRVAFRGARGAFSPSESRMAPLGYVVCIVKIHEPHDESS